MSAIIVIEKEELKSILRETLQETSKHALSPEAKELEILSRKKLLNEKEVEALYGINAGTLRNMRGQGRGPVYLQEVKGSPVFYEHKAIESYMAKMRKVTYE